MKDTEYRHDFTESPGTPQSSNPFRLESERISKQFHDAISCRMADLLEIALAAYAADRQSPRSSGRGHTTQRTIVVRMAVRDPAFWRRSETKERLSDYLYWLSEDEWKFRFIRRQSELSYAESRQYLLSSPPEPPTSVSLFSGGVDSLAGLAAHMQDESGGSRVLVSGYSSSRLARQQRKQVASFMKKSAALGISRDRIHHLMLPFGLQHINPRKEDSSQRTRAFVFLTFGIIAALKARTDTLWIHENGVGAMNWSRQL